MGSLEENGCGVAFSKRKLLSVANSLASWVPECRKLPCESEHECVGYRCRCSFQCVWTEDNEMHYAIRRQQEPVLADYFPIANLRIQKSMAAFQTKINHEKEAFPSLRRNLTSISFTSSWTESGDSDCLVTLHYDVAIHDLAAWKAEAFQVCIDLNLAQITGRSRKRVTRALDNGDSIIRDTLWLIFAEDPMAWKVSLTKCPKRDDDDESAIRTVKYEKPEDTTRTPGLCVVHLNG
jgi:tRNA (Uracil-5-)-methyltransferase